jgi:hypothetical protein
MAPRWWKEPGAWHQEVSPDAVLSLWPSVGASDGRRQRHPPGTEGVSFEARPE